MHSLRTLQVPGYEVQQYLGRGAGSTIWKIRDVQTGDLYALKRVVKRHDGDRIFGLAINETHVAATLQHPAIRRIYRIKRVRRWLKLHEIHLIMEICHGLSLQDRRPDDTEEIVRVFVAVADGLSHMHARGYIHGDIKPNNIMVADDGTVKIIDLGQSCPTGTIKNRIQGTPDFISPEQVQRRPLDVRTDVFNLGAAVYWTCTGRAIPTDLPPDGALTLKADRMVVPITELSPDRPPALAKLVAECIDPYPDNRPQSMAEVVSRLHLIAHTAARNNGIGPAPTDSEQAED